MVRSAGRGASTILPAGRGGRLTEVSEFESIVVKAGQDGALVRVRDIGRVELGAEDYSSRLRFAGVEASGIGIMLLPTAIAAIVDTTRV